MVLVTLASAAYDRILPLSDGRVRVPGVDLVVQTMPVEEVFRRTAAGDFDVAEMSVSTYLQTLEGHGGFIAIPVFASRAFRHNAVYVAAERGISEPRHLVGATVGVPGYQLTVPVWIRGIMADRYGVPVETTRYLVGGLDAPEEIGVPALHAPIDVAAVDAGESLVDLLLTGRLDAIHSPKVPAAFRSGDPRIVQLFPNPRVEEMEYFRETGVFPILHTVVIRREVYERHRWIARELVKAFERAKRLATAPLGETAASATTLPFGYRLHEEAVDLMGADYWAYGVEPNRVTLDTLLRYEHEQGITSRRFGVDEIFAVETAASFRI